MSSRLFHAGFTRFTFVVIGYLTEEEDVNRSCNDLVITNLTAKYSFMQFSNSIQFPQTWRELWATSVGQVNNVLQACAGQL